MLPGASPPLSIYLSIQGGGSGLVWCVGMQWVSVLGNGWGPWSGPVCVCVCVSEVGAGGGAHRSLARCVRAGWAVSLQLAARPRVSAGIRELSAASCVCV